MSRFSVSGWSTIQRAGLLAKPHLVATHRDEPAAQIADSLEERVEKLRFVLELHRIPRNYQHVPVFVDKRNISTDEVDLALQPILTLCGDCPVVDGRPPSIACRGIS